MYGAVAEVMRFQVLFRQRTRVRHALKGGRHDARGKRVAPDLNHLQYLLAKYSLPIVPGHSSQRLIQPSLLVTVALRILPFGVDRNPIARLGRC